MSRSYQHIAQYEKEILELKNQGLTSREIEMKYGFTKEQVKQFVKRFNAKQRKLEAGIAVHRKGRPCKEYIVTQDMKAAELRYIIERKEARIRALEMENELMRDFLSHTERR